MKQYGILAYPTKHSLSPVMHNAAFKSMNIDAQYGVFEVHPDELYKFMETVRHEPISGLSVSLPYKESILEFLDAIDEDAAKIGAVNTVVNVGGRLHGYNTDYIGSNMALKEVYGDLNEALAVVIGGGGAARAVSYGLLKDSSYVWVKNRSKIKADKIALDFAEIFETEIHSVDWDNWNVGDILINATSYWQKHPDVTKNSLPDFCDKTFVDGFKVVMDISYNNHLDNYKDPLLTPLLTVAKSFGKKIIGGDKMLLYQAVEQFKLWTYQDAPKDVMAKALAENLY